MDAKQIITAALGLGGLFLQKAPITVNVESLTVDDLERAFNEILATPVTHLPTTELLPPISLPPEPLKVEVKKGVACIPCVSEHLSTCSGLLAEALRFSRSDGVASDEVVRRITLCQDELNAMERVDLRPEITVNLPEWEKPVAERALIGGRDLRHAIMEINDTAMLEKVAANVQGLTKDVRLNWMKQRITIMSEVEKEKLKDKLKETVEKAAGDTS